MRILSVAPLTKIPLPSPQALLYFHRNRLDVGSIVLITLKNRNVPGVVISCEALTSSKKMHLKKSAGFVLRKIQKTLCKKPFFNNWQIKIAKEIARHYYEPLGLCLSLFIHKQILKSLSFKNYTHNNDIKHHKAEVGVNYEKYDYNKESVLKKIQNNDGVTLFIASDIISAQNWHNYLKNYSKTILIHSKLSRKKGLDVWRSARELTRGIIIGTKTALWHINPRVKLIILHNVGSDYHKSWDQHPKYDARRVVNIINNELGANVILLDQKPCLNFVKLKGHNEKLTIAHCKFVSLKDGKSFINEKNIFSEILVQNLNKIIANNGRALLYLNKKGYAKVVLCRGCGFIPRCDKCQLSLNLINNDLACNVCGKSHNAFNICPRCEGHHFIYFSLGGDFIHKKIKETFPEIKVLKFDLHSAPTIKKQIEMVKEFYASSPSILIGTSLLFKITPDFYPKVDLAVALNIDNDLFFPEYDAAEKAHLNLLKLSAISNKLIIQSFQDTFEQFDLNEELYLRKTMKYPPFYKIVKITVPAKKTFDVSPRAKTLINFLADAAQRIIKSLNLTEVDIILLGPIRKIAKNGASYDIIIKFSHNAFQYKNKLLQLIPVKVDIDVEPKSIL